VRSGKREKVFLNYSLLYQKKIVPSQPKSETEQKMGKIILTGDRPTGKLHLGHYIGSLRRRVELQEAGNYDKMFVFMADVQALTDNADNPEKIRQNIIEVALDYLSAGLDPEKCVLFIQSQITELAELTTYLMNLITVSRVQRNPTVKTEIKMRNFEANFPLGFFCYPVSQAADITLFKSTTVPVGEDQEPMLEVTRELVRRFNATYAPVLVEPNIMLPENATARRLPGTDGKEKMSKSLGNCIYLSDDADTVWQKVRSMYTDPEHINLNDPGHVEGNAVFTYLDAFSKQEDFANFLPEYQNLDELKDHYRRGGLGDMKCKKFLNQILNEMLEPIRQRRHEFEQDIPEIYNILKKGTEKARETAAQTMSEVRAAMRINYFDDEELIQSQAERFRAK
jgi:tryptophanyl-tRNA synthetase